MLRLEDLPSYLSLMSRLHSWISRKCQLFPFATWSKFAQNRTFLTLHWAYFLFTCLIASFIFWLSSSSEISYVNSLFMVIASMTQAGLNTVKMSDLNTFQQCLTVFLFIAGNQIVVSMIVISVRKQAFETRFRKKRKTEEDKRKPTSPKTGKTPLTSSTVAKLDDIASDGRVRTGIVSGMQNVISLIVRNHHHHRENYHVGRNSQFHNLSLEERECVRCVEYQAVKFLGRAVLAYYVIWQIFGCLALGAYISRKYSEVAFKNGTHPWWVGIYLGISSFNNSGMSLLDSGVSPFSKSSYILLSMSILMLAGNTAWTFQLILYLIPNKKNYQSWRDTLQFILQFPRRVYTNLFPSEQTWWLLASLLFFNSLDWTLFELFNHHSPKLNGIKTRTMLLDGFFQTICIRSSGFAVVPIKSFFIGLQAIYVLMMYISAFPITITMRSSNVYEERSLGIYASDLLNSKTNKKSEVNFSDFPIRRRDRFYFVQEQVRRQLSHDLWFIVIGMISIISIESNNYNQDPQQFAIFNIIFETVSAYGCIGFSVGASNHSYSFSGAWHPFSRIILCAVMLRGRHRGLPFDIDKAIQLPGEKTDIAEEQDHQIRARLPDNETTMSGPKIKENV